MNWTGQAVQVLSIGLQGILLFLLQHRKLSSKLPLFTCYVAYDLLRTIVCAITLSRPQLYFYIYWFSAPLEMILMILAAHESFLRTFRTFYLLPWFRIFMPGTIVGALAYAGWKGFTAPPVRASPAASAIISAALAAQYVVLGITISFFALAILMHIPARIHEYRIMLGYAISALAVAFGGGVRSVFGTKFDFLSETLPSVAYILTLTVWLSAVFRAESLSKSAIHEEISGDSVVREFRRRSQLIRTLMRGE